VSRLVLDASAAIRLVLRGSDSRALAEEIKAATLVVVPSIFFSEVANGLWKYAAIKTELTVEECAARLSEAESMIDEVFEDRELMTEALHQAVAYRHPVYDLLYAVLARRTGASVLTRDRRLADLLSQLGIAHRGSRST